MQMTKNSERCARTGIFRAKLRKGRAVTFPSAFRVNRAIRECEIFILKQCHDDASVLRGDPLLNSCDRLDRG
jgi:hypothetical protein